MKPGDLRHGQQLKLADTRAGSLLVLVWTSAVSSCFQLLFACNIPSDLIVVSCFVSLLRFVTSWPLSLDLDVLWFCKLLL